MHIVLTPEERETNTREERERQRHIQPATLGERGCTCESNGRGPAGCALRHHAGDPVSGLHAALERIDKTPCPSCATSPLGATRADWMPHERCRTCGAHGLVGYATVEEQGKWGQLCTMLETLLLSETNRVRCAAFRQIMRESHGLGKAGQDDCPRGRQRVRRFVIHSGQRGVYLGDTIGRDFFALDDERGEWDTAITFATADMAAGAAEARFPQVAVRIVPVEVSSDLPAAEADLVVLFATVEECVAAGLPAWDIDGASKA